jgi:hypothetical protein
LTTPANGVGAVDCRAAARDHVDAFDQVAGDGVDVDQEVARLRRDVTAPVDEHQGPLDAETAKIEDVEAGGADEAVRVSLAEGRTKRGEVVEGVADADVTLAGEVLDADRSDRHVRFEVGPANARSGDGHILLAGSRLVACAVCTWQVRRLAPLPCIRRIVLRKGSAVKANDRPKSAAEPIALELSRLNFLIL